jgi:O-antigen/teichoic acid export membrane protein
MSLRGDVLHSLKWLTGARFAGQLVAWAITLVVIRILKPADYGLMAIAELVIGFAALFQEMGLYTAMVQKRDLTRRQVEQSFGILLTVNSAFYVLVFFGAPWFAAFFGDARLTDIVRVLGLQFPLAAVGVVQDAMLSRSMNFKRKSFVGLAVVVGNGLTTLGFALTGAGVWALVYGSLMGAAIRPIGLVMAARYWCLPRFSRAGMADMMRFGGFVTASRLIWYVYSQADVFIIGKLLGKETLGFYSIAMQLASLPMQKVSALLDQVGFAAYASIQHKMEQLRSHYCKAVRILSIISFPIFWGISSISPDRVNVVLGKRWEPAIVPLQLLSLMMPVRMVSHGGGSALSAIGKPHLGTLNTAISLVIMVPAFFIGAVYGGLTGVTLAWVIAYPFVRLLQLRVSLPPLGLTYRDYLQPMLVPALGGALMYLVVVLARHTIADPLLAPAVGLAFLAALGALTYTAFMWFVAPDDCREMIDLLWKPR